MALTLSLDAAPRRPTRPISPGRPTGSTRWSTGTSTRSRRSSPAASARTSPQDLAQETFVDRVQAARALRPALRLRPPVAARHRHQGGRRPPPRGAPAARALPPRRRRSPTRRTPSTRRRWTRDLVRRPDRPRPPRPRRPAAARLGRAVLRGDRPAALNVPVGTVRSRINRARRKLSDHLNGGPHDRSADRAARGARAPRLDAAPVHARIDELARRSAAAAAAPRAQRSPRSPPRPRRRPHHRRHADRAPSRSPPPPRPSCTRSATRSARRARRRRVLRRPRSPVRRPPATAAASSIRTWCAATKGREVVIVDGKTQARRLLDAEARLRHDSAAGPARRSRPSRRRWRSGCARRR